MDIKFIPQEEIDKVKWNSCVHYAHNGNIFGYKWYLDGVAREWDALVEGDYESVMPLMWRKNWLGGRELYVPGLIREAGIYSIHLLSPRRIEAFLEAIPEEYRYKALHLAQGSPELEEKKWQSEEVANYQMLLEQPYEEIAGAYSAGLLRRLEVSEKAELLPSGALKPERLADFYRDHSPNHSGKERKYHALMRIMYNALHRGWGFSTGIMNRDQELLAAGFFTTSHSRLFKLIALASPEGMKVAALEQMLDQLIRRSAGRPLLLDWDASSPAEVQIAKDFGGQKVNYFRIQKGKKWF